MYLDEFNCGLFKGKYRIKSVRLDYWDYSSYGWYFVTICTKNREEYFGEIKNGIMGLSEIGCITAKCWKEIPKHFPSVTLDEWAVMPNHVHGIIILNGSQQTVETQNFATLRNNCNWRQNKYGPQSKNLGSIMRGFKIGVKKYAVMNQIDFSWQSRYYDHIIRNEKSLDAIREYIRNNPLKWEYDRNNPSYPWN